MPVIGKAKWERFAQFPKKGDRSDPFRFYVYELVDPRDGHVFYVGKGSGRRALAHMSGASRGDFSNPGKAVKILDIQAAGFEVDVRIVSDGLTEQQAFMIERETIAGHGMAALTNISRGSRTERDRAIAEAKDGLQMMAWHISEIIRGVRYSAREMAMIFEVARGLRRALGIAGAR